MALVAKTNIELDELLQERPKTVFYTPPPEPVEEQHRTESNRNNGRRTNDEVHQAIAKWKNECNQIDRIGVLCGDKP